MKKSVIFSSIFSVFLIVASAVLLLNRQQVIDWWRLKDYSPSPVISSLATKASMNDEGRHLFYVHYPEVLNKEDFQGKCDNNEVTIILGCYISHDKIYIFQVTDKKLEGIEEVTAAHEMLHAAYDRMSPLEKQNVDKILVSTFNNLHDERLSKTIESYRSVDPTVVPNELHSILGTEVANLPKELEDHYSKYFTDRQKVVSLAVEYENEFTDLEDRIASFDVQLTDLKTQISQQEVDLEQLSSSLQTEKNRLEALSSSPKEYNKAVPGFNSLVRNYNSRINTLQSLIKQYNDIVSTRNSIAVQQQTLINAIDSRFTTIN